MLETSLLAKALVGAEAGNAVGNIKYAAPTADEAKVTEIVQAEIGRIEARLSVMLSHIEGNYESQVANLKLKLVTPKPWVLYTAVGVAFVVGAAVGHFA